VSKISSLDSIAQSLMFIMIKPSHQKRLITFYPFCLKKQRSVKSILETFPSKMIKNFNYPE
jgi:hypothetical protein